ncbi:MAG: molybdopterin-dependent oxidoreductase, partial [Solirubrobacterales bacterium]
ELRIRKAVRRNGSQLLVAGERPTALDGGAAIGSEGCLEAHRYPPAGAAGFLNGLRSALTRGDEGNGFAKALRAAESVVVLWSERLLGDDGPEVAEALLGLADVLGLDGMEGGGLLEVPRSANGRGLREAGCSESFGPGFTEVPASRSAAEIRQALEDGELHGLILWDVDPVRDFDDPEGWARAIGAADFTLSSSMFGGASAQNADVHFPAETFAEKEGTVTHPDGRLQRVRPSVPHPGAVRPLWQALTELSALLGDETGAGTSEEVFDLLASDVPFLKGITIDDIGGMGLRWPELAMGGVESGPEGADAERPGPPSAGAPADEPMTPTDETGSGSRGVPSEGTPDAPLGDREVRLGTYRDLWADYVSERNPGLRFLSPSQTLELNPVDAERLGVSHGERVEVSANGRSLIAAVGLRERMLEGSAFLVEGLAENGANRLAGARVVSVRAAPEEPVGEASHKSGAREATSWA